MNPGDQPADLREILLRREKWALCGACGWIGAGILIYAAGHAFQWNMLERIAALKASGQDFHKLLLNSMVLTEYAGLFLVICMLGMLICLMRWVSAIRRRRKIPAGVFER